MATKFWGIEIWDATGRHYYTEVNISEDNINEFIERVNDYNKTVDYISLVEKGFKKSEGYDDQ